MDEHVPEWVLHLLYDFKVMMVSKGGSKKIIHLRCNCCRITTFLIKDLIINLGSNINLNYPVIQLANSLSLPDTYTVSQCVHDQSISICDIMVEWSRWIIISKISKITKNAAQRGWPQVNKAPQSPNYFLTPHCTGWLCDNFSWLRGRLILAQNRHFELYLLISFSKILYAF